MFSTSELQYIDTLIPTYAKEGYKSYVIYSNTMVNSGWNYSTEPDIYAIFCKEDITATGAYSYDIKEPFLFVSVRCSDYSSSSSADNSARVVVEEREAQTITIDEYEHIYTNAEFDSYTLQPDFTLSSEGGNIIATQTLGIVITCALLVSLFFSFFSHR